MAAPKKVHTVVLETKALKTFERKPQATKFIREYVKSNEEVSKDDFVVYSAPFIEAE